LNNFPLAKECFPYLFAVGIFALILFFILPWLSLIPGVLLLFIAFFFRNPHRRVVPDTRSALSPADGVITEIVKTRENKYLHQEVWKVTIFLNIFNVHFNRSPVTGDVEFVQYVPGKFIPAFKSHASEINERNYVIINTKKNKVMVVQITGFIARRIVYWVKKGDTVTQGDRFGLIKFGSCTEVYLPLDYSIVVGKGQKVKGGLTVIGRLDE